MSGQERSTEAKSPRTRPHSRAQFERHSGESAPARILTLEVRHGVRAAADRLRAHWSSEFGAAMNLAEAGVALDWLAGAVEKASAGAALPRGGPAATILGRRLLELLRSELVGLWALPGGGSATSSAEMIRVLGAFETVRASIEPDWSQHFESQLAGPDGLALVVEVAHDLRSPLTSILFLAESLSRGQSGAVNELQKRQLCLVYTAALSLSSMASDVVELARGGDDLMETELAPFSVGEVLESVADMVRPIAEEKGLEVRFAVPADDQRLGRPQALSRVLLNLTTNALKFTDHGYVEISTRPLGPAQLLFSVRDTGRGMSEEAMANLYQPFRRTTARTAGQSGYHFSGSGLGLAMCRKLVEGMGSELLCESRTGWGTRFSCALDLPPAMTRYAVR